MGEHPVDAFVEWLEWTRRTGQESLCARPQHLGLELGIWRRSRRVLLRCRHWLGDRRLGNVAEQRVRTRRHQADRRTHWTLGDRSDIALAGHGWTDDPHRARYGHSTRSSYGCGSP